MLPRILSIIGPVSVYFTSAVLAYGIALHRVKFEYAALAVALPGLILSILFVPPTHRLFFDEDLYINIASNLTRAPVNQVTVMGGPDDIQVSSYYKEPAGWPVLLSFAFLAAGRSETVAFGFARILFALTLAAVYELARELLPARQQALIAAALFGMTPISFWYSVSAGTDMAAALLAVLGMLGLATENGALAAAGFAFAAQTRMELMTLIPLVWLAPKISRKWKILTGVLVAVEVVHIAWVMSVAPALARSEEVSEVFGLRYLGSNLFEDLRYFFTPFKFPFIASIFAGGAALMRPRLKKGDSRTLLLWIAGPSLVYLLFYGGSFNVNPRYSLQVLAPLVILCASLATQPVAIAALLISAAVSIAQQYEVTPYGAALEADHRLCVDFAAQLRPDDLVVTGQPELFLNQNRSAMSATLASMRKERLKDEIRKRKVWYHSGVRANVLDGEEWTADQWLRSNFDLRLMDSHESGGFKTAFYELSVKHD